MNTRALATKSIVDIINKKYSLLTLDSKLAKLDISPSDKSFTKLLCYEFFRYYFSLEKTVDSFIKANTKKEIKILLMLGVLQLFKINQPHYASINETVNACKTLKMLWAKKLVNGVLRNTIRNIENLNIQFLKYSGLDAPKWLIETLIEQYPTKYKQIISNSNQHADMFIRINKSKDDTKVLKYLSNNEIAYTKTDIKNALKLSKPIDVRNNELFNKGYFTVQDLSAQYCGLIINPQADDTILDACAAPGGKTTHLMELNPRTKVTAIDLVDKRLELLTKNATRVSPQNNISVLKHDLTKSLNGSFNKIILDAPCSAVGTLRRNPDIKVLRNPKDVEEITSVQQKILQNLWDNNLKKDGLLLYITCSILKKENQLQIKNFLDKNLNAEILEISILNDHKAKLGYQILPENGKGDGFYYCLIKKIS